jgi:3-phosphoshikimate 1-carboxyvinyltransferase
MKNITIQTANIGGSIAVPTSKSLCHRAVIAASLAKGQSVIKQVSLSRDIIATCDAMEQLGACISKQAMPDGTYMLMIDGCDNVVTPADVIDCDESGSTLRFLIPILLTSNQLATVTGMPGLAGRPLTPYQDAFQNQPIEFDQIKNTFPIQVKGPLQADSFILPGDVSSQFITGLLFATPLLDGNSNIIIKNTLQSVPYVDMSVDILDIFGISVDNVNHQVFSICGKQLYRATQYTVEPDWSQAAFWLVMGAIGEKAVSVKRLKIRSAQGDKVIVDILRTMGVDIEETDMWITAKPSKLVATTIDVIDCPDLVPVLAVAAGLAQGTTIITNAERLRIKECNRLAAMVDVLTAIGGKITEQPDGLHIEGVLRYKGNEVNGWNDHRIVMALAVAAVACDGELTIHGAEAVSKSYPSFWEDYVNMGGVIDEKSVG